MAAYTRLGQGLFDWKPFYTLTSDEKVVWLALYASSLAKHSGVPGLLRASAVSVGEAARIGYLDAQQILRSMQERGVIEVDEEARVIRLTELPDNGERPFNHRSLKGMWSKWQAIPESPLKYRWVATLRWLVGELDEKMSETWAATFGTVEAKAQATYAQEPVESVDKQLSLVDKYEPKENRPLNSIDTVSILSGTGTGTGTGSGVSSKGPPGFTVMQVLSALGRTSKGRVETSMCDSRLNDQLREVLRECESQSVTLADVELAGEYLAAGYLSYRTDLDCVWVAKPGNLLGAVAKARSWDKAGRPKVNGTAETKKLRRGGMSTSVLVERALRMEAEGR